MSGALYIGLMSGTSVDGIDAALVKCDAGHCALLATHQHDIPQPIREQVAAICRPGPDEIERLGVLDRDLGHLFAVAALALVEAAGRRPDEVRAIGSHGQTVRHRPPSGGRPGIGSFTLQLGDPNTIAEETGITTVADFRRRDIAAGGEGAPLAPAFHAAALAAEGAHRAIINIGGIANASLLDGMHLRLGFDTGPGNTLLDQWIRRHRGATRDTDGRWAAQGSVVPALLERLLQHPYLAKTGPRSTGRETFHLDWLDECLACCGPLQPVDVQSTLAQFTAVTIARGIRSDGWAASEVYLCGGGAHNRDLVERIARLVAPAHLDSTQALGIDPDWVEAAAFGWLAHRTLEGLAGNAPVVTGARGPRVLGGIYPA